ncbi:alpha/beta fold hydrolase [Micromonospora sp. NPDC049102]|uniref:alpha/beta fold hydrolase n=1 Tax=Micromonospora sp. NPDC049102 TaxID=3364265 RepID=UPI003711E9E0
MFDGFEEFDIATSGTTIRGRRGGDGPPVLLLHGVPETHLMWHKVAPRLAEHFTVVATDLRGWGDSGPGCVRRRPWLCTQPALYTRPTSAYVLCSASTKATPEGHERFLR